LRQGDHFAITATVLSSTEIFAEISATSNRLHKGNQRNLVAFLRPGKPSAKTGAEIGEAKVKPAAA